MDLPLMKAHVNNNQDTERSSVLFHECAAWYERTGYCKAFGAAGDCMRSRQRAQERMTIPMDRPSYHPGIVTSTMGWTNLGTANFANSKHVYQRHCIIGTGVPSGLMASYRGPKSVGMPAQSQDETRSIGE